MRQGHRQGKAYLRGQVILFLPALGATSVSLRDEAFRPIRYKGHRDLVRGLDNREPERAFEK